MPRWLIAPIAALLAAGPLAADDDARHFTERVQPLLASRCVSCHGPDEQEGKLRLDTREGMLKGGKQGPSIVPGKPAESLLIKSVRHEVPKPEQAMPPKEKLSEADIAALEKWIADGAVWPADATMNPAPTSSAERIGDAWHDPRNPIVKIFRGERLDLWSLKPVVRPSVSEIRNPQSNRRARTANARCSRPPHARPPPALRPHRPAADTRGRINHSE